MPDKNKKQETVLLVSNSRIGVFGFRKELVQRLVKEGYRVVVSFTNGPFGEGEAESKECGCEFIETVIDRRGTNPFKDLKLVKQYKDLLNKVRPDYVFAYTVKPDIYAGMACKKAGIKFYPNITGLGKGLTEGKLVSTVLKSLYRRGIKKAECVFFQNDSDKKFFDDNKIGYNRCRVLPGSGVNLEKFKPLPYPDDKKVIFTYVARVMKAKGIEEFFEAAEYLKNKYDNCEFHICGYCEEDYKEKIREYADKGIVVYHGLVKDIMEYEKMSHCIVMPSFHPEGVSNVLLEGAACGRPLITTDWTGCRDAVNDGVSGYLVEPRNSKDLIEKMEKFLSLSNEERKQMGLAGREFVEKKFDRNIIVQAYLDEIRS